VRARRGSWSPLSGETEDLIEPTWLRPNHSMSQFGRRDERHPGVRVARQHTLALEMVRKASPTGNTGDDHEALSGFVVHDVKRD
jgi:hypothetical protein